jgi:Nucleotidyl transferase AbiEii toxin, Type IV TA system
MNRSFLPLMTILPEAQKLLWPALKPTRSLGFVLYGGTAIALRLGHRLSIDFDFFNDKPLDKEKIRTAFPFMSQATVLQDEVETLTVLVKDIGATPESATLLWI